MLCVLPKVAKRFASSSIPKKFLPINGFIYGNNLARPTAPPEQPSAEYQPGMTLYCPEHEGVKLIQTKAQWQVYDEIDGQSVPAKYFCPGEENGTGANHSLWRRDGIPG